MVKFVPGDTVLAEKFDFFVQNRKDYIFYIETKANEARKAITVAPGTLLPFNSLNHH